MKKQRGASTLRKSVGLLTALLLCLSWFSPAQQTLRQFPARLSLTAGQMRTLTIGAPLTLTPVTGQLAVNASQDERLRNQGAVELLSEASGTSELLLSLFGLVPIKRVEVDVSPETRLIPGGQAVGVAMQLNGVLVVGLGDTDGASPAKASGIQPGDVLRQVNGVDVTSAQQLARLIAQSGTQPLPIAFDRNGTLLHATLTPALDAATGTARMGAWVRDSTAGVGTLSFYDPAKGRYGALGHAITDGDTGQVLPVGQGQVLAAQVVAVQKGKRGLPGELKGSFLRQAQVLGDIRTNSTLGIYGTLDTPCVNPLYPDGVPIGLRGNVHTGKATILSTVDGQGVRAYEVEITRLFDQSSPAPKSMILRVTDPALLEKTGGIVQGMSGSPILQDGRIIGAVTHVFVSDPTQGYGLYIDWMLEQAAQ